MPIIDPFLARRLATSMRLPCRSILIRYPLSPPPKSHSYLPPSLPPPRSNRHSSCHLISSRRAPKHPHHHLETPQHICVASDRETLFHPGAHCSHHRR